MITKNTAAESAIWLLDGTQAKLHTPPLAASIDLLHPQAGLGNLRYREDALRGFVLGVVPETDEPLARAELQEGFVRGNDLVVTYAETKARPFSFQVYWRVTSVEQGVIVIDTILSFQTDLLESFPSLSVMTELPAVEHHDLPIESGSSVLVRAVESDWSYAETTHPEDQVERLKTSQHSGTLQLQRRLGGRFMEKGVIRRLRVRGVFLPRENDTALANELLASLATEEPPLTA